MALDNYVPVPVRIAKFKKDHNGEGSITTVADINYEKEVASFKATIMVGDKVVATGHSLVADLGDDKAFEKGETTAVGRALVLAGYEAESAEFEEESSSSKKSSKKSGLGSKSSKGLGAKKSAKKVEEEEVEEEEAVEEEGTEEEAPKKKSKGLPSLGKSSKKKKVVEEDEEDESEDEEEVVEDDSDEEEEEEAPKKKSSGKSSSQLADVMAKYGLK